MKISNKLFISLYIIVFVAASLQANPPHNMNKNNLPHGLEKKVERGGSLPPGWQKKLKKGERIDPEVLKHGHEVHGKYDQFEDTIVYQVGSRIFRIAKDSREILEILH